MAAHRSRLRASTRRTYERLARAALLDNGELSHHVKRWQPSTKRVLKTVLYRLGYRRQAMAVQLEGGVA